MVDTNHDLMRRIQDAAVMSSTNVGEVLRMCKVLAARLGSRPLEDWLIWETEGYPKEIELPPYRIWRMEIMGHFSGPFGSGLRNAPIPRALIPKNIRQNVTTFKCRQGVSSLSTQMESVKSGKALQVSTGDLSLILGQDVYEGMNCIQAWGEISSQHFHEIIDTVRNKLLDFVLKLETQMPAEDDSYQSAVTPESVTQVFNTTVYGSVSGVIGSSSHSQVTVSNINQGDFGSLKEYLASQGIDEADLGALKQAIEEDSPPNSSGQFGARVSNWLGQMIKKAASGAWRIGLDSASTVLSVALLRYYGLH